MGQRKQQTPTRENIGLSSIWDSIGGRLHELSGKRQVPEDLSHDAWDLETPTNTMTTETGAATGAYTVVQPDSPPGPIMDEQTGFTIVGATLEEEALPNMGSQPRIYADQAKAGSYGP